MEVFTLPETPSQLLLFEDKILRLFSWSDLTQITVLDEAGASASHGDDSYNRAGMADIDAVSIASGGDDLVFVEKAPRNPHAATAVASQHLQTKVHVFDISSLKHYAVDAAAAPSDKSSPSNMFLEGNINFGFPSPLISGSLLVTGPFRPVSPLTPHVAITSQQRRSSICNVTDIPHVETVTGTVKRFNSWFLVFISPLGWVCSVELNGGAILDTFQKHFFIPSAWRTGNAVMITKMRRNQDIVFVHNAGVIVVKNGLDNGEHVSFF